MRPIIEPTADELKVRVAELDARVQQLEREVEFLRLHPTLAQGLKGERFICAITRGVSTQLNARFDITVGESTKLEVKFSKLNTPEKSAPDTHRWSWSKPMGWLDKGKDYDFLLLLGEKDPRFSAQYLDDVPYVVFLVPAAQVPGIVASGKAIGANVNLTTNFQTVRSPAGRRIIEHMVPYALVGEMLERAQPLFATGSSDSISKALPVGSMDASDANVWAHPPHLSTHLTTYFAPGDYENPLAASGRGRTIAAFHLAQGDVDRLGQQEMRRDVLNVLMSTSAVNYWLNSQGWLEKTRKIGKVQLLRLTDKGLVACANSLNGGGAVSTTAELVEVWKQRMKSGEAGYEKRSFSPLLCHRGEP